MIPKVNLERKPISTWSCRDVNQHYFELAKVGSGTYGEVCKAHLKDDPSKIVALKKIRDETETEGFPITALREISILQSLDHPNVVKLLEVATAKPLDTKKKSNSTYLVFEYLEHELLGLIDSVKLTPAHVKCIMKQLLEGLDYLHALNIIHRDIKSANILINNRGEVKLADFGLAKKIHHGSNLTPRVVTRWYRAPELLLGSRKYTGKIDMWALGCVFAELLIGKPSALFPAQKTPDQFDLICEKCGVPDDESWPGHRSLPLYSELKAKRSYQRTLNQYMKKIAPNVDDVSLELLDLMLTFDPEKRISAQDALKHSYFSTHPLPCDLSEMPKIEKDCHSYTITSEREKRREMNQNNQAGQANQHGKSLPFPNKGGQHHNNPHFNKNANPFFQKQTQAPNPINQNMGMNQQHHRSHGDSTQQSQHSHFSKGNAQTHTKTKPTQEHQPGKPDFLQKSGPIEEHKEDNRKTRNGNIDAKEGANKKAGQQDLSSLEKISKKQCTEQTKAGNDSKVQSNGTTVDVAANGK